MLRSDSDNRTLFSNVLIWENKNFTTPTGCQIFGGKFLVHKS